MTIAGTLSWEIQAQNDRGDTSAQQRMALEIAYGVALEVGNQPERFSAVMSAIIDQVSDTEMQQLLQFYTKRGLK